MRNKIIVENCKDFGKKDCGISEQADMFDYEYCWKCFDEL